MDWISGAFQGKSNLGLDAQMALKGSSASFEGRIGLLASLAS